MRESYIFPNSPTILNDLNLIVGSLIREAEHKLNKPILSAMIYHGDILIDNEEKEGTKIDFDTTLDDSVDYEVEPMEELLISEDDITPESILNMYLSKKIDLTNLMLDSGTLLDNEYINIIKLEKSECRKALSKFFNLNDEADKKRYTTLCKLL